MIGIAFAWPAPGASPIQRASAGPSRDAVVALGRLRNLRAEIRAIQEGDG